MKIKKLFDDMWTSYAKLNPQVVKVRDLMENHEGSPVKNDHIAIRTFNHPRVNRHILAKSFLDSGYKKVEDLVFDKKKLDATYYLHDDEDLTRVFISELRLEDFSEGLQKVVNDLVDQIPDNANEQFDFCNSGTPWNMITKETYDILKEESEYAAWVATFGFIVNHFTISVTECDSFDNLEQVNSYLKKNGYRINDSGGEIKGSADQGLEQSSIMAEDVNIDFSTSTSKIPGCYYEFALRHNEFDGFIASSADKIFESTDNKLNTPIEEHFHPDGSLNILDHSKITKEDYDNHW